ncbi:MAG: ABC transporter ATP-binding protein [Acidobacteria bacterium]|nr:ABC transporter ATP-binding protein [Acidobacteriota bacterium]
MLEVRNLTKVYGALTAVDGVSFVARPGEILGYLGPNGSGKTTTVGMVTGLLKPTSGEVLFEGKDIQEDLRAYKLRLGYVPEEPALYPYLTGREYLELVARLRHISEGRLGEKIPRLLELLSLPDSFATIAAYSKGMKQKVLVAAAILHNPDVLILDEPFSGLDVESAMVLREVITDLARDGKTILFSSHLLEVVEKVCARVLILSKGRVVAEDTVERLCELQKQPKLERVFSELTAQTDPVTTANKILTVVKSGG